MTYTPVLRRLLAGLLTLMLLFSLIGCGEAQLPAPSVSETTSVTVPSESTSVSPESTEEPAPSTSEVSEPTETQPVTEATEPVTTEPTQPETTGTVPPVESEVIGTLTPQTRPTDPQSTETQPVTTAPTEPPETQPVITTPTEPPETQPVTTVPAEPPETQPVTTPPTEPPEPQPPTPPSGESSFRVHFIDVGQADAALIECDGQTMLIDGGNAPDSNLMYTYLKKHGITHLNYVIGTHAHEDHIGGIAGALNYATVDTTFCPVTSYTSKAFSNFVKAVEKQGSTVTVPRLGYEFNLGSASCRIVGVNSTDETNNSSIVLRIVYGSTSFLFTGDAEAEAEAIILEHGYDLRSNVLKVGHHGSRSSTGYRWLREVAPDYAVISVGKDNTYGHPTEDVLSRLRDADVTTFRTDLQGDILCTSDGTTLQFTVNRNADADAFGGIGSNSTQKPNSPSQEETHYILNTNSRKFHEPDCGSAKRISSKNRKDYYGSRNELIEDGYDPCGNCDP